MHHCTTENLDNRSWVVKIKDFISALWIILFARKPKRYEVINAALKIRVVRLNDAPRISRKLLFETYLDSFYYDEERDVKNFTNVLVNYYAYYLKKSSSSNIEIDGPNSKILSTACNFLKRRIYLDKVRTKK